jgi:hypothetical protein
MNPRTAFLAALLLAGCAKLMGYGDDKRAPAPLKHYPDGADGLQALFGDVLEAARKDDRDHVHDLLASTFATDDDLRALLGARGSALAPRYHLLMETLVNRGAVELVAQVYERKLDTVEVMAIEPAAPDAGAGDRSVARALVTPTPIYSVRIKKAGDTRGLRYDFFFYRNGKWLTGNQLGKFIE